MGERDGSFSPARSTTMPGTERRERTLPPSPLTKLPVPRELPRVSSPSPSRVSIPLRTSSPFRSSSPNRAPRYVPPPVASHTTQPRRHRGRSDGVATSWQTESLKKAFRGYLVGEATPHYQQRTDSPSPFDRLTKEEFSSMFPVGSLVVIRGEKEGLKDEEARVVGHTSTGRVEVQIANDAVITMHPSNLKLQDDGMCSLQGAPHDCELSPARSTRVLDEGLAFGITPLKGEPFLRESLASQQKVFNHTIAKHHSILIEERTRRENAEKQLAQLKGGITAAMLLTQSTNLVSRYFVIWKRWYAGEHWHKAQNNQGRETAGSPASPVRSVLMREGSPTLSQQSMSFSSVVSPGRSAREARRDFEDKLEQLRMEDQTLLNAEKERFEKLSKEHTEMLLEKLRWVKEELEGKDAEIMKERLVSASLRHKLKESHQPVGDSKCSQCGGSPTPTPPPVDLGAAEGDGDPASPEGFTMEAPASPLAVEVTQLQQKVVSLKVNNMKLQEQRDSGVWHDERQTSLMRERDELQRELDQAKTQSDKQQKETVNEKEALEGALHKREADLQAAKLKVHELEKLMKTKGIEDTTNVTVPWEEKEKEDPKYTAAKKKHKAAVERAGSVTRKAGTTRGRGNSTPRKRTGSLTTGDHTPVQAYQYSVGSDVKASNLNGTTISGRVVGHNHGRVEILASDGSLYKVLPNRIRSPITHDQDPDTPPTRGRDPTYKPSITTTTITRPVFEPEVVQEAAAPSPSPAADERTSIVHTATPSLTPGEDEVVLIQMGPPAASPAGFKLEGKNITPARRKSKKGN
eukprot:TRINITY_DN874_c0_g1_i9.p1 TRINITY_DN874_c0_g1~~TRINITY_DN874_c0_g1_i9.p1  ORF type:complete len:803 (+),score=224.13 TRINITY_DN874_c0_g1_i9:356-2764(+)